MSNLSDVISAQTLSRIANYAKVVGKTPRMIIDRELNRFMEEEGEYTMQQLAMRSKKSQRAKKALEQGLRDATCIDTNPQFSLAPELKAASAGR